MTVSVEGARPRPGDQRRRDAERLRGGGRRGRARGVRVHGRRALRRQRPDPDAGRLADRAARSLRGVQARRRGVRRHVEPPARRRQRRPPPRQRLRARARASTARRAWSRSSRTASSTGSRRPSTATARRRATTSTSATSPGRSCSPASPGGRGRTTSAPASGPRCSSCSTRSSARPASRSSGSPSRCARASCAPVRSTPRGSGTSSAGSRPSAWTKGSRRRSPGIAPPTGLKAVLLAAGLGTRMRGAFGDVPKILAPVRRRGRCSTTSSTIWPAQGVDEVAINLHHHADAVVEHLGRGTAGAGRVSVEEALLGTAGALVPLTPFLDEPFVRPLRRRRHRPRAGELLGGIRRHRNARLLPEQRTRGQGRARGRRPTARQAFVEKGRGRGRGPGQRRVYLLDPAILDHIGDPPSPISATTSGRAALAAGAAITAVPVDAYVQGRGHARGARGGRARPRTMIAGCRPTPASRTASPPTSAS